MAEHILVIGGGIAGLSAASELLRDGFAVTLLEAKERLGGRIYSLQQGPFVLELGAEFVHGRSKALLNTIQAAGLTTVPASEQQQIFEKSKFHPANLWEHISQVLHQVDPRKPDCSFREFARGLDPRSRRLATAFVEGYHAAPAERISVHSLLRAESAAEAINISQQARIGEGYSKLIDSLELDIRARGGVIVKGAVVRNVEWKFGQVEVRAVRHAQPETFSAECAIFTLPLGIWKSSAVRFDPPLTSKADAINGLEMGHVTKITLVFKDTWWPEADFGFIHALDEPIPTWWSDSRGPILTGWAGGRKALELVTRSPEQLEALALQILRRVFRQRSISTPLIASHTCNWANDLDILGAYSFIPVNGLDLPELLAAPIDETLYFAGEATVSDAQTGTVFGALESGLRAAHEVRATHEVREVLAS